MSPALIAALERGATLRCPRELLPTLLVCVGASQAEMQAEVMEASRGKDITIRMRER